jgi:hypothetical protein
MNLPDPMDVRSRIENVKDVETQMFLKALYLLGAMVSEMTGKVYPSEIHLHDAYGPTGTDAWEASVYVQKILISAKFFRIKTAKKEGDERTVALPTEYEPWTKGLYDYFKKAGNEVVFTFTRQQAYERVKNAKIFKKLQYPVEYGMVSHQKAFGIDNLRYVRAKELELKYDFKTEDLEAYGICNLSIRRVHKQIAVSLTSESDAQPWNRYLLKLCK